jgi:hypothetical protein
MKKLLAVVSLLVAMPLIAADMPSVFYVYSDKGAITNHYIPSGWMGDYGDMKIYDGDRTNPKTGSTDIKIVYTAQGSQGANWAGIYWQHPSNNWGAVEGGYNLSKYTKMKFFARAESHGKVPVRISEFKVGGITGEYSDSDAMSIGPVDLTKDWKEYTIDLAGKDLHHIIGAFCWSASKDDNPDGFDLYLDEIRFE